MRYMHSRLTFQGKDATNHLKKQKQNPQNNNHNKKS